MADGYSGIGLRDSRAEDVSGSDCGEKNRLEGLAMFVLLLLALAQDFDTLETIRDAVNENRSLDSLEVRYYRYDPESKVSSPKYTWAFQGRQYRISFDGEQGRAAKDWT